jgi:hypothetical protein
MADVQLEQNRAFGGVIDILEAIGIEYVIWGGVAAITYGEPRFTRDMDVVVRLRYSEVDTLARVLEEDGYYVSDEAIAGHDPILIWAFEHRQMKNFDEFRQASYMPPESVTLTKLRAYQDSGSTRHLDDIEGILRVSEPELDLAYIDREAARIGAFGTWRELLDKSGLA